MEAGKWASFGFLVQTNPLLIDTVLRSLFTIVDYGTLKECRRVCSKWKEFGDPEFIKQSAFVLKGTSSESLLKTPVGIPTLFKSINQEEGGVRFSAFKFDDVVLTRAVIDVYIKPNILTLVEIDITPAIDDESDEHCNFDELISPNLSKLKLNGSSDSWKVSVEKLVSIRHIHLSSCTIVAHSWSKMSPEELTLKYCDFEGNTHPNEGGVISPTNYSEIIDFRNLSTLKIHQWDSGLSTPILNLEDCCNIKILHLNCIKLNLNGKMSPEELSLKNIHYTLNGEDVYVILFSNIINSSAHIKKMFIRDRYFADYGQYQQKIFDFENIVPVDELEIVRGVTTKGINPGTVIKILKFATPDEIDVGFDISNLPSMLEILDFGNHYFPCPNPISCSSPVSFLNLKQLAFRGLEDDLEHFQGRCPSLIYFEFERYKNVDKNILPVFNIEYFPPHIKGLSLKNFDGEIVGNTVLNLEVLVLLLEEPVNSEKMIYFQLQIANKIKADLTVLHCNRDFDSVQYLPERDIKQFLCLKSKIPYTGNIACGPVLWKHNQLNDPVLMSLVDKKADYYLFEQHCQKGKGMSKMELLKMIPFDL